MPLKRETSAFLIALIEMPETMAAITRDVWQWMAGIWLRYIAARPILWFVIVYFGLIASFIGWRYIGGNSGGTGVLSWAFWEKPSGQSENGTTLSGPEGIRNLIWSLATLLGGAVAGIGLLLAAHRTKAASHQAEAALQQSETAFQSLVTERFTKAVEQLGHEKRAVRLGAIYALERIAKDSPRDRDTIVETLAAYIRELAPWPPVDEKGKPLDDAALETEKARIGVRPPIDIAAALMVICRLLPPCDPLRLKTDLSSTDLRGLDGHTICLTGMFLNKTNLAWSILSRANLAWASFAYADLSDVSLNKTILRNADLAGTNLKDVRDLTQEQINGTRYHRDHPPENLPEGLTLPEPYDIDS